MAIKMRPRLTERSDVSLRSNLTLDIFLLEICLIKEKCQGFNSRRQLTLPLVA